MSLFSQRLPKHRSASLIHFNEKLKGKQNSQNETHPDFHSSVSESSSLDLHECYKHCTYIMNAATAFNYSWPLATYWYCVCSWVIYAPETWISAFIVHLPAISVYVLCAPKHVCLFLTSSCPYVCVCCCWQKGRVAPGRSLAVVCWSMASSLSLCRLLSALHTPQGSSLLPWQWWAKIEETSLAGCRLCCAGLWRWSSPQQKGT